MEFAFGNIPLPNETHFGFHSPELRYRLKPLVLHPSERNLVPTEKQDEKWQ